MDGRQQHRGTAVGEGAIAIAPEQAPRGGSLVVVSADLAARIRDLVVAVPGLRPVLDGLLDRRERSATCRRASPSPPTRALRRTLRAPVGATVRDRGGGRSPSISPADDVARDQLGTGFDDLIYRALGRTPAIGGAERSGGHRRRPHRPTRRLRQRRRARHLAAEVAADAGAGDTYGWPPNAAAGRRRGRRDDPLSSTPRWQAPARPPAAPAARVLATARRSAGRGSAAPPGPRAARHDPHRDEVDTDPPPATRAAA
jgi:hypothetical protein